MNDTETDHPSGSSESPAKAEPLKTDCPPSQLSEVMQRGGLRLAAPAASLMLHVLLLPLLLDGLRHWREPVKLPEPIPVEVAILPEKTRASVPTALPIAPASPGRPAVTPAPAPAATPVAPAAPSPPRPQAALRAAAPLAVAAAPRPASAPPSEPGTLLASSLSALSDASQPAPLPSQAEAVDPQTVAGRLRPPEAAAAALARAAAPVAASAPYGGAPAPARVPGGLPASRPKAEIAANPLPPRSQPLAAKAAAEVAGASAEPARGAQAAVSAPTVMSPPAQAASKTPPPVPPNAASFVPRAPAQVSVPARATALRPSTSFSAPAPAPSQAPAVRPGAAGEAHALRAEPAKVAALAVPDLAPVEPPGAEDALAKLRLELDALPCSRLELAEDSGAGLVLRGRVSREDDRTRLEGLLADAGPGSSRFEVDLVEAPFCTLLDAIEPHAGPGPVPSLRFNRSDGLFRDGEFVVVTTKIPEDFERGYLHVLFADHTGKVVHMLPNRFQRDVSVVAGQTVQVGVEGADRRPGVRDFRVVAPYGPGLVIALLSPVPLAEIGAAEVESVDAFADAVITAFSSQTARPLRVALKWLETAPP